MERNEMRLVIVLSVMKDLLLENAEQEEIM
jgi:hypothetical protein